MAQCPGAQHRAEAEGAQATGAAQQVDRAQAGAAKRGHSAVPTEEGLGYCSKRDLRAGGTGLLGAQGGHGGTHMNLGQGEGQPGHSSHRGGWYPPSHSHLLQRHRPRPLHSTSLEFRQPSVDLMHWHAEPSKPGSQRHRPQSQRPRTGRQCRHHHSAACQAQGPAHPEGAGDTAPRACAAHPHLLCCPRLDQSLLLQCA